jgi:hypothetical protein
VQNPSKWRESKEDEDEDEDVEGTSPASTIDKTGPKLAIFDHNNLEPEAPGRLECQTMAPFVPAARAEGGGGGALLVHVLPLDVLICWAGPNRLAQSHLAHPRLWRHAGTLGAHLGPPQTCDNDNHKRVHYRVSIRIASIHLDLERGNGRASHQERRKSSSNPRARDKCCGTTGMWLSPSSCFSLGDDFSLPFGCRVERDPCQSGQMSSSSHTWHQSTVARTFRTFRTFWDYAAEHPVALFFLIVAIGWAVSSVVSCRKRVIFVNRPDEDKAEDQS